MAKVSEFCRSCCCRLGSQKYFLAVKNDLLTPVGEALYQLTGFDSKSGVGDVTNLRFCKHCYDEIIRLKKSQDLFEEKRAHLKDKIHKASGFFLGRKHVRETPSPYGKFRIPTPMKSPLAKRLSAPQPCSARVLFASPPKSDTSMDSKIPSRPPSHSLLPAMSKPPCVQSSPVHASFHGQPSMIPRRGPRSSPLPVLKPVVDENSLKLIIDDECDHLCSTSVSYLRGNVSTLCDDFSWSSFEAELQQTAPTLWSVLKAAATPLGSKYVRKHEIAHHTTCIVAAGLLLNKRNSHMCGLQVLLSLLLWHGHSTTMVRLTTYNNYYVFTIQ